MDFVLVGFYTVDFVLVGSWFLLMCRSFSRKSLCHVFFLFYFYILVDILPKLISGYFPISTPIIILLKY